jgi:hypothetical protein
LGNPTSLNPNNSVSVEELKAQQRARVYHYLLPKEEDSRTFRAWKASVSTSLAQKTLTIDEFCEIMTLRTTGLHKKR